jgi:hypothetical protein
MKRRKETLPVASLDVLDSTLPAISPLTKIDNPSNIVPDVNRLESAASEPDTMSSVGDSTAPTPRPSKKQASAHVLIVDDNDINLKVRPPTCSTGR